METNVVGVSEYIAEYDKFTIKSVNCIITYGDLKVIFYM